MESERIYDWASIQSFANKDGERVYKLEFIARKGAEDEDTMGIGCYSAAELAELVASKIKYATGFCKAPEDYRILPIHLNRLYWMRDGKLSLEPERLPTEDEQACWTRRPPSPTDPPSAA